MDFRIPFTNEFDPKKQIQPSDLEQSKFRIALVSIVLTGTCFAWVLPAIPSELCMNANLISAAYLALSIVIWLLNRKNLSGQLQLYLRSLSLVGDVTVASVFIAHTGSLSVFILPISITIIIGYGFRFGFLYSLAALAATVIGFMFAVRANGFLRDQAMLSASLFVAVIYAPIYSYYLLGKYRALLEHRNHLLEERESLIETITHEFRSPLHALIFLIDCARQHCTERHRFADYEHAERLSELLEKASISSERMVSLADRLLAIHIDQPESGGEPTNFARALRDSIEICRIHARRRGIRLYWRIAHDVPPFVRMEGQIFQDVVINVLDNAIKHTGGTSVVCEVSLSGKCALTIYIHDAPKEAPPAPNSRLNPRQNKGPSEVLRPRGGAGRLIIKRQLKRLGGSLEERKTETNWHTTLTIPIESTDAKPDVNLSFSVALHIGRSPLAPSNVEYLMAEGVLCRFLHPSHDICTEDLAASVDVVLLDESVEWEEAERLSALATNTHVPVIGRLASDVSSTDPLTFPINAVVNKGSLEGLSCVAAMVRKGRDGASSTISPMLSGLSGLVVDDSNIARLAISDYLGQQGASVSVAGSLVEGEREANSHQRFDFAVLDAQLGNDDGLDLVAHLRGSHGPHIVVVVLTGHSTPELVAATESIGVDDVLLKSCSGGDLVTALLAAFEKRRMQRRTGPFRPNGYEASEVALLEGLSSEQRAKAHSEFMRKLAHCVYAADSGSAKDALRHLHQVDGIAQLCGMPSNVTQILDQIRERITRGERLPDRSLRDLNKEIIGLFRRPT